MRAPSSDRPTANGATAARVGTASADDEGAVRSLVVGVDPGTSTGLAVYDPAAPGVSALGPAGALVACGSLDFWKATAQLHRTAGTVRAVVVEDPRTLGLYARYRTLSQAQRDRAARSVGQIDRDVSLWVDLCRRLGVRCVCVPPARRAKWAAADLAAVTGWTSPTNEHARDAARLAWEWGRANGRPLASGNGATVGAVCT